MERVLYPSEVFSYLLFAFLPPMEVPPSDSLLWTPQSLKHASETALPMVFRGVSAVKEWHLSVNVLLVLLQLWTVSTPPPIHLEYSFVHPLNIQFARFFSMNDHAFSVTFSWSSSYFLNGKSSLGLNLYTPPKKSLFPWFLEPDPHSYFFTGTVPCFFDPFYEK